MEKKIKRLIPLSFLIFFSFISPAQNTTISGTVKNSSTQETMPSVTVTIKGTAIINQTDEKGNFRITSDKGLPVTLVFSSASFESIEISVTENKKSLQVEMVPRIFIDNPIVIGATRMPTRFLDAPVSIEQFNATKILNAAALDYYSMANNLKGVDMTTSGLLFKTISTRGFNATGNLRLIQLVDGMDNSVPVLNFPVGNFLGITELDVANVELLPGASSVLYGPGGMNGTVLITSKDPFNEPGLSIQVKQGIMNLGNKHRENANSYSDFSFRWAQSFKDKFAFKINAQLITAKDWQADDSTNIIQTGTSTILAPGNRQSDPNYNGVNVYGDETTVDLRDFMNSTPQFQNLFANFLNTPQFVSRTGYAEKDIIDLQTYNVKISGALHYKISKKLEAQLVGYWGTGRTPYTANGRILFNNPKLWQSKLELKHKKGFLRISTVQEKAIQTYDIGITTRYLNEGWKPSFDPANINGSWYPQYFGAFAAGADQVFQSVINGGGTTAQAQQAVYNAASQLHAASRPFADQGRPAAGSPQFNQLFDQFRKILIPNGGGFFDISYQWSGEAQYDFTDKIKFADIIVGANFRTNRLNSNGTIYIDTLKPITINESAVYTTISKKLLSERLTLTFSGRYDKNEDFKGRFTPRATALINIAKNNNLRMSYQTAYRFPSTIEKYLIIDFGPYTVIGGLPWSLDYMHVKTDPVIELINFVPASTPYIYKEFKPESVRTFELGYKGLITNKLLIDVYGYTGQHKNFILSNTLFQPSTGKVFASFVNSSVKVKSHGFGLGLDYQLPKDYKVNLNAYSDVLSNVPAGFKTYYNTPKYRLNMGLSNSTLGKNKNYGFNITYHWQDAFFFESIFGDKPISAYSTIDAQVSHTFLKNRSMMIKLGGTNILNHYYQNGFGHPYVGAVYYISILCTAF